MSISMNWIWITLLVIAVVSVKTCCQTPNSPFCENETRIYCPKGVISEGSCTVDKIHTQDCKYKYHLNESVDGSSLHYGTSELGEVKLEPYPYVGKYRHHSNLNISFSNIKWTSLIAKFTVLMDEKNEVQCRNFTIRDLKKDLPVSTVLFWDCHWFQAKDSWLPIKVEIQAIKGNYAEYRKFQFQLPKIGNIDKKNTTAKDWELLVYRETHGETTTIHWSRLPEKFGTTKYRVYLNELKNCSDSSQLKETHELTDGTYETKIDVKLDYATCYNVSVQPWLGNSSWGRQSYSQPFFINLSNEGVVNSILVIATSALLLVVCLCLLWHIFRSKKYKKVDLKKCLLVYEPTSEEHLEVVKKFAIFLESLQIPVHFFHSEIERSSERPADWWARKLGDERDSDLILIISSPSSKNEEDIMNASKYAPVFTRGFVEGTLYKLVQNKFRTNKPRFIRILLPYCSTSNFYNFLKADPCYHVFDDRFKLLQEILGLWWAPRISFSAAFKSEPWFQFENAVKKITNREEIQTNLKSESLHSLIEDLSVSASENDEDTAILEQRNKVLLQMLDEESCLDAECIVATHIVIAEGGEDAIASKSSPNEGAVDSSSKENVDEKMKGMFKFL